MLQNEDVPMLKRFANIVLVILTPYLLFFLHLDSTVTTTLIWSVWAVGLTWIWVAHPLMNRRRSHK